MFLILFNKIIDVSFKHKSTCCLQAQQNPGSPTSPPSGEEAKQKKGTRPPPQKKEWQAQQADAGPAADPSPPATPPSWLQAKKTIHKVTQA